MTTAPTTRPPLSWWSHAWRMAVVGLFSLVAFAVTFVERADISEDGVAHNLTDGVAALLLVDLGLGLLSFGLVLLRRRWPLAIALALAVAATFSSSAAGPAVLATVSVATRRRWQDVAILALPNIVGAAIFERLSQPEPMSWPLLVAFGGAVYVAMIAAGFYLGARRDLISTLRWRAETAERAQAAQVEQGKVAERNRIAREMHDVLAHRISVVVMYAGALNARDDLTDEERRTSAQVIEDNARLALTDLREVLGVLRQPAPGAAAEAAVEPPQPTLAGLAHLLAEATGLGGEITLQLDGRVVDAGSPDVAGWVSRVPEGVSRAAYRVVQEGLTNARKHAPGAPVTLDLSGQPSDHLVVDLRNAAAPPGAGSRSVPGAGLGLVGLRERAELLGGHLESRGLPDGGHLLRVRLPWRP